jgi:hypothetical protein
MLLLKISKWYSPQALKFNLAAVKQARQSGILHLNRAAPWFSRGLVTQMVKGTLVSWSILSFLTLIVGSVVWTFHSFVIPLIDPNLVSAIPFSVYDIFQGLAYLMSLSCGWLLIVTFNHFGDVVSMFSEHNTSGGFLLTALSYIYVVCVNTGYEFILTLFTNPRELFSTVAVLELVTTYDSICDLLLSLNNFVTGYLWTPLGDVIKVLTGAFGLGIGKSISFIGNCIVVGWTYGIDLIAGIITPQGPSIFQPIFDSLSRKIATGIAVTIIIWILRVFLGFPF